MTQIQLYVGTYNHQDREQTADPVSNGIFRFAFDTETGSLTANGSLGGIKNPSFLCLTKDNQTLYAVEELAAGRVRTIDLGASDGALTHVGNAASQGADACYITTDATNRTVLVANYSSGTVASFAVDQKSPGSNALAEASSVHQQSGTGPILDRQEGPHAHCIVVDPTNTFAFSADLGADTIFGYKLDASSGSLQTHNRLSLTPGSGPRHLTFSSSGRTAVVVNELDQTITVLSYEQGTGTLTVGETYSTLPSGFVGESFVADVHLHPNGRFVYVSNRGHDSIAMFALDEDGGTLHSLGHRSTDGSIPRNFAIAPDGKHLLVANQDGNSIVTINLDPKTGLLGETVAVTSVYRPVCLAFSST